MKMIKQTKIETKKQKNLLLSILCFCLALFISGCGSSKNSAFEPEENFEIKEHGRDCTITGYRGNSMELNIPSKIGDRTVTKIGDNAFKGCTAIVNVTIPDTVKKIGKWAFAGCSSLESITIPEGVAEIMFATFEDCSSLQSVTIPNSVTKIDYKAFRYCSSLKSVTIPSGAEIDSGAFDDDCIVHKK